MWSPAVTAVRPVSAVGASCTVPKRSVALPVPALVVAVNVAAAVRPIWSCVGVQLYDAST
jgi:hypothetical protein